jgi:hypothetical protein
LPKEAEILIKVRVQKVTPGVDGNSIAEKAI